MPVKPIKSVRPFRPISPISPNRKNLSPIISYQSDYSSDSLQSIETKIENNLLFDFSSDVSSYESSYESKSTEKNWKPNSKGISSSTIKSVNINIDHSLHSSNKKSDKNQNQMYSNLQKSTIKNPQSYQEHTKISSHPPSKGDSQLVDYYSYSSYDPNNDQDSDKSDRKILQESKQPEKQTDTNNYHVNTQQNFQPAEARTNQNEHNIENQNRQKTSQTKQISSQAKLQSSNDKYLNDTQVDEAKQKSNLQEQFFESKPEEQTFHISYTQKTIQILWKRQVFMTKDDVLFYACSSINNANFGKIHIISTKTSISDPNSEYYRGTIVRHQTGRRFTLYEKLSNIRSSPQIAGIAFIEPKENTRIRMFRVALPIDGQIYTAATKKEDLSRIAFKNENVPSNIKVYQSMMPIKREDGSLTLNLNNYAVVKSTKNFCIKDEKGENVFIIFKTYGEICILKFKPPFTPLIAYAIAVAISTSEK